MSARALREAAGNDDPEGIDEALARGAKIDVTDMVGRTALHWAAGRGRVAATRHLLQLGARVKLADNQQTALHLLADSGSREGAVLVELLVQAAPWALTATDSLGNTPLDRAKRGKNQEMVAAIMGALAVASGGSLVANDLLDTAAAGPKKKRGYFATMLFGKVTEDSDHFSLLTQGQPLEAGQRV